MFFRGQARELQRVETQAAHEFVKHLLRAPVDRAVLARDLECRPLLGPRPGDDQIPEVEDHRRLRLAVADRQGRFLRGPTATQGEPDRVEDG